jgi:hypothetical protein
LIEGTVVRNGSSSPVINKYSFSIGAGGVLCRSCNNATTQCCEKVMPPATWPLYMRALGCTLLCAPEWARLRGPPGMVRHEVAESKMDVEAPNS